jgi:hypothetical protein
VLALRAATLASTGCSSLVLRTRTNEKDIFYDGVSSAQVEARLGAPVTNEHLSSTTTVGDVRRKAKAAKQYCECFCPNRCYTNSERNSLSWKAGLPRGRCRKTGRMTATASREPGPPAKGWF